MKNPRPLRVMTPVVKKPPCELDKFLERESKKPWYLREKPYKIKCDCSKCKKK